jgi:hypothetical protein
MLADAEGERLELLAYTFVAENPRRLYSGFEIFARDYRGRFFDQVAAADERSGPIQLSHLVRNGGTRVFEFHLLPGKRRKLDFVWACRLSDRRFQSGSVCLCVAYRRLVRRRRSSVWRSMMARPAAPVRLYSTRRAGVTEPKGLGLSVTILHARIRNAWLKANTHNMPRLIRHPTRARSHGALVLGQQ